MKEKSYSDKCAICLRGRRSPDGRSVLCARRGVVEPDYCCRSFRYDPLKREPMAAPKPSEHSPDEFSL
ncbi:MAG: hypothetical protein PUB05_04645 [Firmicutes bacterium]|nr:hypothetical protein [Bacillota bacterium]